MGNRLTRRRNLIIGGCIFAACCIAGLGIQGAQAAMVLTSTIASGEIVGGSSDWAWAASNGDLGNIPLKGGQEILTGSYTVSQLMKENQYQGQQTLDNTETILFQTQSKTESRGPGIFAESLMLDDVGAPAAAVECGNLNLQEEANQSMVEATGYCERVVFDTQFMSRDNLQYQSQGAIGQASDIIPDSFSMAALGAGNGMGSIRFNAASMAGIGNTTELGYTNHINEHIFAGGKQFMLGKEVQWTSFRLTFDSPAVEAEP